MTVRQLLESVDSRELSEWAAYHSIEPIGSFRSDLQAGIVASVMANCHRSQKSSKTFQPMDFMPIGDHNKKKDMTGADMKAMMVGFAKSQNEKLNG